MTIGIGGAGCKLAVKLNSNATLVNVSEVELGKVVGGGQRIVAAIHAGRGQFQGSRMNPEIGYRAYISIRQELLALSRGSMVFSSTGGGTGNGITTGMLEDLTKANNIETEDKTFFNLLLPYAKLESSEFISNTSSFLAGPLAAAIDSGNTGNIVLFSNHYKFEHKVSESAYNDMLIHSLQTFLSIPKKSAKLQLLDGHIDEEDFILYTSKPYFNHFAYFNYDASQDFGKQLNQNQNPYLLPSEAAIEALFLLEVPTGGDSTIFYNILEYFKSKNVSPIYSVIENPDITEPFITVSLLYSRKPAELVNDFNKISSEHAQEKVRKSLDQYVKLEKLEVNLEKDAAQEVHQRGEKDEVLAILRRIGKL
ncbi:MAG: hypothetical protein WCS73_03370 [Lentisphaeria bacterium]